MFDFANSPTVGQIISGPGGTQYEWDGVKWVLVPGVVTGFAPISSPHFTGVPTAPTATPGDNTNQLATDAFVQQAISAGTATGNNVGRNLLHNSQFLLWQRGIGPVTVPSSYTADRWIHFANVDTFSAQLVTLNDANRTQIGDETAINGYYNVFTGNVSAAAYNILAQRIWRVRRLSNKTVTLSFWAQATTSGLSLGVSADQVFGTGGSPSALVTGSGWAVPISTTFTRYAVTLTIPSAAGKVFGTNNDDCTQINIWYSSGLGMSSRSGIGIQAGTIILWGVQLEVGSQMTPYEHIDPSIETNNCLRYYQGGIVNSSWYAVGGMNIWWTVPLVPSMRGTPTITTSGVVPGNCALMQISPQGNVAVTTEVTHGATGGAYFSANFAASADL